MNVSSGAAKAFKCVFFAFSCVKLIVSMLTNASSFQLVCQPHNHSWLHLMVVNQSDLHPILYASFFFPSFKFLQRVFVYRIFSLAGRGHKIQGLDRSQLVYWNPLQPGLAVWGVFWTSIFILVIGYQVFFVWNTQDFLTAYVNIPIFLILWIGWTVYMRTPFWRAHEMDFVTVRCVRAPFLRCFNPLTWLRAISGCLFFRASLRSRRQKARKTLPATWAKRSSTSCSESFLAGKSNFLFWPSLASHAHMRPSRLIP